MQLCKLPYIPQRLHTNNKVNNNAFVVGEFLYMRCNQDVLDNPYKSISITELSHNRSGENNSISVAEDVLYSIKAEENIEKHNDKKICSLEIIDLNKNNSYRKKFTQEKNGCQFEAILELFHEAEPCMYPHCVFRVTLNNERVTYNNYKDTLQKVNKIRNSIKEELASMIVRMEVSQIGNPNS